MKRLSKLTPGAILGVIALVVALAGTAFAAGNLKLGMFEDSSRDRLAGTGVIQYAAASHVIPANASATPETVLRYEVKCELSKKATAGGFKWTATPPDAGHFELVDAYPTAQGFVVRIRATGASADNKALDVYANCVKSRAQRGTPPA
jgi:hypothetical protein